MILRVDNQSVVVFDLDDTLYQELDFVISGFKSIVEKHFTDNHEYLLKAMLNWHNLNENVFEKLLSFFVAELNNDEYTIEGLIYTYRNHFPSINLNPGGQRLMDQLKLLGCKIGLITDGRGITQKNKIKALGLDNYFELIIISEEFGSEKPCYKNFQVFQDKFPLSNHFVYIGDNTQKDFIIPNKLGWLTICLLDSGKNIHKQDFTLPEHYLPRIKVTSLNEILV